MSIKVDRRYVLNVTEQQSSKLHPVNAEKFMTALEEIYGPSKVKGAIRWLLNPNTQNAYSGMKDFTDRFTTALGSPKAQLVGDDQKYLVDIAFRFANGLIRPVQI